MKTLINTLLSALLLFSMQSAQAALNVFACEPEWGALVQELGGDKVSVYVATQALQDVHHVQARPSLLAKMRSANLVVCTGAELEVGWLPVLLQQAGNPAIQPGKPAYFEATNYVQRLEIPQRLDRADGDIHPLGNPHIQTDPRNIAKVSDALAQRLAEVLTQLQRQPARMIVRAAYDDERASQWLAERAKIPVVVLPYTVGGSDRAKDLFGLFDDSVQRLLDANK